MYDIQYNQLLKLFNFEILIKCFQFAKIVDLLEKRCHKMYSSSSYCMYIIIELLFTIFIHNFSDHQEELSANIVCDLFYLYKFA